MRTVFHDELSQADQALYQPGDILMRSSVTDFRDAAYSLEHVRVVSRASPFWDVENSDYRHDVLGMHEPEPAAFRYGRSTDNLSGYTWSEKERRWERPLTTRERQMIDARDQRNAIHACELLEPQGDPGGETPAPITAISDELLEDLCGEMGRPTPITDRISEILDKLAELPSLEEMTGLVDKLADAVYDDDLDRWATPDAKPIGGDLPQGINRDGPFVWRIPGEQLPPPVLKGPGEWLIGGPHPQPFPKPAHQIAWSEEAPEMPDEHPVEDAFEPEALTDYPAGVDLDTRSDSALKQIMDGRLANKITAERNDRTMSDAELEAAFPGCLEPTPLSTTPFRKFREYDVEGDEFYLVYSLSHWGMH